MPTFDDLYMFGWAAVFVWFMWKILKMKHIETTQEVIGPMTDADKRRLSEWYRENPTYFYDE